MTKKELNKWLLQKENDAVRSHERKFNELQRQFKDEAFSDLEFDKAAEKIQAHLTEALKLWNAWKNEQAHNAALRYNGGYYSLENSLYRFTREPNSTYQSLTDSEIILVNDTLSKLKKRRQEIKGHILKTYADVIAVVDSLKTVKEALAYLNELGFDLSELERKPEPVTALAVKIDTSYLFPSKAA